MLTPPAIARSPLPHDTVSRVYEPSAAESALNRALAVEIAPVSPLSPLSPFGPCGIWPDLKSPTRSVPSKTCPVRIGTRSDLRGLHSVALKLKGANAVPRHVQNGCVARATESDKECKAGDDERGRGTVLPQFGHSETSSVCECVAVVSGLALPGASPRQRRRHQPGSTNRPNRVLSGEGRLGQASW